MKLFLIGVHDASFTNRETGENVDYRNAEFIDYSNKDNSNEHKGHRTAKAGIAPGILASVKADDLPGWFEVELTVGSRGKMVITRAVPEVKPGQVRAA